VTMFRKVAPEEVNRKLLHGLVVILPLGIFYAPTLFELDRTAMAALVFVLLLISIFVEVLRQRNVYFGEWFHITFGSMLRTEERNHLTGATYVVGATFLCAWMSTASETMAACSCLALTLFILGDAVAALVGKSIGRIRIGEKTLEGAVGCFVLCLVLAYWVFPRLPGFLDAWGGGLSWMHAIVVGSSVALLELFPVKLGHLQLNDNLYVPVLVTMIAYAVC